MADKIDFSMTSYVLGILSIVLAFLSPLVGLTLGIIGLVQSSREKTKITRVSRNLNIIGIALNVLVFVISYFLLSKLGLNMPTQ